MTTARWSRGSGSPVPGAPWVAGLAALALALGSCGGRAPRAHGGDSKASAPADPAARMSLEEAHFAAVSRFERREWAESLPYFLRVEELLAPDVWAFHLDFANALQNAAVDPATRSSYERVRLVHAALGEVARARRLAERDPDRREALRVEARYLRFWGFPLDAEVSLRRAHTPESWLPAVIDSLRGH